MCEHVEQVARARLLDVPTPVVVFGARVLTKSNVQQRRKRDAATRGPLYRWYRTPLWAAAGLFLTYKIIITRTLHCANEKLLLLLYQITVAVTHHASRRHTARVRLSEAPQNQCAVNGSAWKSCVHVVNMHAWAVIHRHICLRVLL